MLLSTNTAYKVLSTNFFLQTPPTKPYLQTTSFNLDSYASCHWCNHRLVQFYTRFWVIFPSYGNLPLSLVCITIPRELHMTLESKLFLQNYQPFLAQAMSSLHIMLKAAPKEFYSYIWSCFKEKNIDFSLQNGDHISFIQTRLWTLVSSVWIIGSAVAKQYHILAVFTLGWQI